MSFLRWLPRVEKIFHFRFHFAINLDEQGSGRLKPSPESFFVASLPGLLSLAISLVGWLTAPTRYETQAG